MKKLMITAALVVGLSGPALAVDPVESIPFGAGSADLAWGAPYAVVGGILAAGIVRMYIVGEIERRCWTENDNQAVLVGPLSSGSKKCYQGPGAVKYKAP